MTQNPFKDLTIKGKIDVFNQLFSLGTNTNSSIKDKFDILYLICYLTFQMKIKFPDKFKTSLDVLQHLYGKTFSEIIGEESYLINLSIFCDELLFGVDNIPKPDGFTNASEICAKIKELASQWLPF